MVTGLSEAGPYVVASRGVVEGAEAARREAEELRREVEREIEAHRVTRSTLEAELTAARLLLAQRHSTPGDSALDQDTSAHTAHHHGDSMLQREVAVLKARLEGAQAEYRAVCDQADGLERESEALRLDKERLERRCAFKEEQLSLLKAQGEAMHAQLTAEVEALREMGGEGIRRQVKSRDDTIARLTDELASLRRALATAHLEQGRDSPMPAEVDNLLARLREESHHQHGELHDQIAELKSQVKRLEDELKQQQAKPEENHNYHQQQQQQQQQQQRLTTKKMVLMPRNASRGLDYSVNASLNVSSGYETTAAHNNNLHHPPSSAGLTAGQAYELEEMRGMYADLQALSNQALRDLEDSRTELRRRCEEEARRANEAEAERDRLTRDLQNARREHERAKASAEESRHTADHAAAELEELALHAERNRRGAQDALDHVARLRERVVALEARLARAGVDVAEEEATGVERPGTIANGVESPSRVPRLEAQVSTLRRQVGELEELGREREEALALYEHQRSRWQRRADDCEAQAEALLARLEEQERQELERRQIYDHLSREKAEEQRRRADVEAELATARGETEALRRQMAMLESSRSALDVELSTCRVRCVELEQFVGRVPELHAIREALEAQLEAREAQIVQAREEGAQERARAQLADRERARVEAAVAALEGELGQAARDAQERAAELEEARAQARDAQAYGKSVDALQAALRAEVETLERRLATLAEREKEALRQQQALAAQAEQYCKEAYAELTACKVEREGQLAERDSALLQLRGELESQRRLAAELQAQLREVTAAAREAAEDYSHGRSSLEVQLRALQGELGAVQAALGKADGARRELETALRRVDSERAQWEEKYHASRKAHTDEVRRVSEQAEAESARLRTELETAKSGRDLVLGELQDQLAGGSDMQQRLELATRLLRERTAEAETLQAHVREFAGELQRAAELLRGRDQIIRQQALDLESSGAQSSLQLSAAAAKLEEMRQALVDRDQRSAALEHEVGRLQASVGPLFNTLGAVWDKLKEHERLDPSRAARGHGGGVDKGVQAQVFEGLKGLQEIARLSETQLRSMLLDTTLQLRQVTEENKKLSAMLDSLRR